MKTIYQHKKPMHPFDVQPSYGFQKGEETKFLKWLWEYKKALQELTPKIGAKRDTNANYMEFYINLKNEREEVQKMFTQRLHSKTWKKYVHSALVSNQIPDELRTYLIERRIAFYDRIL
jgi:hypothetical protein